MDPSDDVHGGGAIKLALVAVGGAMTLSEV